MGEEVDDRGLSQNARGRTLIRRGRTYDGLIRDQYRGWTFNKTKLTDKYTLADFRNDRPQADIVAEVRPDGTLSMVGPSRDPRGGEGATLISFSPERDPEIKEVETVEPG